MLTQKGANTHVVAIHGNFDDAQTGVKEDFWRQRIWQRAGRKRISAVLCKFY